MAEPSASSGEVLHGEAKRRYVADLFSRITPRYDLMNTVMTAGMHHRWRRVAAAIATRGLEGVETPKGGRGEGRREAAALDVATGTGDLSFALGRARGYRYNGRPRPGPGNDIARSL